MLIIYICIHLFTGRKKLPSDGTPVVDKTVTVTLPEGKSVFDIDYLSLWCRQANADFGHVIILLI